MNTNLYNVTFNELPIDSKNALLEYCYMSCETLDEVESLYVNNLFDLEWISIEEAKERCMSNMADWSGYQGKSFDEFHNEYVGDGFNIPYYGDSVWPVIEGGDEEWLDDGWHRFNSYVYYGIRELPVLRIK